MIKNENKRDNNVSLLIILPCCYGNFKKVSIFCRNCDIKENCKEIHPPKEPIWCNYV